MLPGRLQIFVIPKNKNYTSYIIYIIFRNFYFLTLILNFHQHISFIILWSINYRLGIFGNNIKTKVLIFCRKDISSKFPKTWINNFVNRLVISSIRFQTNFGFFSSIFKSIWRQTVWHVHVRIVHKRTLLSIVFILFICFIFLSCRCKTF